MFAYNPFHVYDLVVWNGIICKFGSINQLVEFDDFVRLAEKSEVEEYNRIRKW